MSSDPTLGGSRPITPAQLAEYLEVSLPTLYAALAAGEIPGAFRIRRGWRIDFDVFRAQAFGGGDQPNTRPDTESDQQIAARSDAENEEDR